MTITMGNKQPLYWWVFRSVQLKGRQGRAFTDPNTDTLPRLGDYITQAPGSTRLFGIPLSLPPE